MASVAPALSHHPRLVAPYLPTDDDADDADDTDADADDDTSFLADDSLDDSVDDWSDDADSDDSDPDSDDCSAAWNTNSKHAHSHSHLHKKSSFHSACDYLSFFGALRKGFCSRPLDQRIEVSTSLKRPQAAVSGGGESALHENNRFVKTGGRDVPCKHWVSPGFNHKDREVALSLNTMFKCTVADTPKILFKRANSSEDFDEMDMNAHEAAANVSEDLAESDEKSRHRTERENVRDVTMVRECDGNGSSKNSAEGVRSRENIRKDMAHKEYVEAPVQSGVRVSRTNPCPSAGQSKLVDDKLNLQAMDKPSNGSKNSDQRKCSRESNKDGPHNKGNSKPAISDCSNKFSKNLNQVALASKFESSKMINVRESRLEPQENDSVSLEKNAIPQSQDLERETVSCADNLCGPAVVDVPTSLNKKVTQSEVSPDTAKVQDTPLHIYMKEKHQPEVVVKDPKRRAKAKKVKASKGKKLHLFRDGFTLPSAIEPAGDAESTPVQDKQSESNNKVLSPKTLVKTQILKEAVPSSAAEDDVHPLLIRKIGSNAFQVVDGVPLTDATGPVATLISTNTQLEIPVSNDSDQAVVTLPGSVSKGFVLSSASYQNIHAGDTSNMCYTEGGHASQPHSGAQISGFSEEDIITSMPPSPLTSSRWFPQLDAALQDPVPAPALLITSKGSSSMPDPLIDRSLATSMTNLSSTTLIHEPDPSSECFENFQGDLLFAGNTEISASLNSSSFIEVPSTAYPLGKRVVSRAMSPRSSTMDISNSRFLQAPLSQNQAFAPNFVSPMSLQQDTNPPVFNTSTWIQPRAHSGPGFPFPFAPTTSASFGQVICCNNQTLSMYKQMKSFSIEARYLVNVPSIVPGCCKLFLFNVESRQLHGVFVSSSLQTAIDHEFPVAFDCIENYSLPLLVGELGTILPEAKHMNGRPLLLLHHTVEQLVTMLERKNKPRLAWVPCTTNPVSVGVHGLKESSAIAFESSCTQDRLVEAMGHGSSLNSASPVSLASNEVAKDCWSPFSTGPSARISQSGEALIAHEPDSHLTTSRVFPFPASSLNSGEEAKAVWPKAQTGFTRKPPELGVAPSPMALWPHLFPKASSAETKKESFVHMKTRGGNSTQGFSTCVSEMFDRGSRLDPESDAGIYSSLPESGIRSNVNRPKLAYNPLALEQSRQRHHFDGSKPSTWSPLASELDLQQTSQYGNGPSFQENNFTDSLSSALLSELKLKNIGGAAPTPSHLPSHYQVDHSLSDILRNDVGLSKAGTAKTTSAWNGEPHLHPPSTSERVPGAANFDQTNRCCYCLTRRADHLIIDCREFSTLDLRKVLLILDRRSAERCCHRFSDVRLHFRSQPRWSWCHCKALKLSVIKCCDAEHLGPCLECAASKKIEYCGQLNCQTKVTRLLRLFRPI